jgi:hypothetical protein
MIGELITLPVRVGVRAARLWVRAAEETLAVAANATGQLIDRATRGSSDAPDADDWLAPTSPEFGASATAARPPQPPREPPAPRAPVPKPPPEPEESLGALVGSARAHVSEEPELVEELAEPGAEDGAGAEVHVDEPWDGYTQMNAKDVIARLTVASPAELAAVQLYESGNRGRQTILAAARRALRSANGSGSRSKRQREE